MNYSLDCTNSRVWESELEMDLGFANPWRLGETEFKKWEPKKLLLLGEFGHQRGCLTGELALRWPIFCGETEFREGKLGFLDLGEIGENGEEGVLVAVFLVSRWPQVGKLPSQTEL